MNQFIIFILLLPALINSILYKPEEGVLELNIDNFNETVAKNKYLLVEFYQPRCKYCKKVRPEFIKAARRMVDAKAKAEIVFAGVDIKIHRELGIRFNVKGVPAFRFFINGEMIEYKAGQSADDFVTWLIDHSDL